jgi:hypothetical protein
MITIMGMTIYHQKNPERNRIRPRKYQNHHSVDYGHIEIIKNHIVELEIRIWDGGIIH